MKSLGVSLDHEFPVKGGGNRARRPALLSCRGINSQQGAHENTISHQVGRHELCRVPLPQRPTVREVRDRSPQCHVIWILIIPARKRILHELNEVRVVVVVDGVTVDMPQHVPHIGVDGRVVEICTGEHATLNPEWLRDVEARMVKLLEASFTRH